MVEKSDNGNGLMRGERLQIMLAPAELEVIDDFRFKWRMPSRAATVRELLRRGLASERVPDARDRNSSAFGVIDSEQEAEG
jgi:hypothetical protein